MTKPKLEFVGPKRTIISLTWDLKKLSFDDPKAALSEVVGKLDQITISTTIQGKSSRLPVEIYVSCVIDSCDVPTISSKIQALVGGALTGFSLYSFRGSNALRGHFLLPDGSNFLEVMIPIAMKFFFGKDRLLKKETAPLFTYLKYHKRTEHFDGDNWIDDEEVIRVFAKETLEENHFHRRLVGMELFPV